MKRGFDYAFMFNAVNGGDSSRNGDPDEISFHAPRGTYTVKIKVSRHCLVQKIEASLHYQTHEVGQLTGIILPRPQRVFYEMADEYGGELQRLACMFCDKDGCANRIETGMPAEDVNSGGFLHIDRMKIEQGHKGQDLGLLMLHHLLFFVKDDWKLAVLEAVPQSDRLCVENGTAAVVTDDKFAEVKDKLQRHYARMGFQQAGRDGDTCDSWFLTAFKYFQNNTKVSTTWKSRVEIQSLDVYVPPAKYRPRGLDLELRRLVQECAPLNQVTTIVRSGASIHGSRVLFILAAKNDEDTPILKTLVGLGDVNEADETGCRPLHIAALKANAAMIQILLSAGADRSLRNGKGQTPMDCLESQKQDTADFFGAMGITKVRPMDVDPYWKSATALMPANVSSTLVDGWLSPRMIFALQVTAEEEISVLQDETARIFTKFQPTSLSYCCGFSGIQRIDYIPAEVLHRNPEGFYKSFADGWEIVWKAMLMLLQRNQAISISLVHQEICNGHFMYDLRKFNHFVDKGGKIDYAIDAILKITEHVVVEGDDGWEYGMFRDEIEALPATPFDKAFDLARVRCLEITNQNFVTQPGGPYNHNFDEDTYHDGDDEGDY